MNFLKTQLVLLKQNPKGYMVKNSRVLLVALFLFALVGNFAVAPQATYAQCVDGSDPDGNPCLDIDADTLTSQIFDGANIIVAALGGIVFLIVGLRFGGNLLRGIGDAISNFRF